MRLLSSTNWPMFCAGCRPFIRCQLLAYVVMEERQWTVNVTGMLADSRMCLHRVNSWPPSTGNLNWYDSWLGEDVAFSDSICITNRLLRTYTVQNCSLHTTSVCLWVDRFNIVFMYVHLSAQLKTSDSKVTI